MGLGEYYHYQADTISRTHDAYVPLVTKTEIVHRHKLKGLPVDALFKRKAEDVFESIQFPRTQLKKKQQLKQG